MRKLSKSDEYAVMVAEAILGLFNEEEDGGNPVHHLNLDTLDATAFITSLVKSCHLVYSRLTSDESKTSLEFTYLLNQLIVQDMLNNRQLKVLEPEEDEE